MRSAKGTLSMSNREDDECVSVKSDVEFAGELSDAAEPAIAAFLTRFMTALAEAWDHFRVIVPRSRIEPSAVSPFIGRASGRGYDRYYVQKGLDVRFDDYVSGLELKDMTLVGACVCEDDPSIQHLDHMISTKIVPTLLSLWRRGSFPGIGRTCVEEAGGALIGHLWMKTRSDELKLASYLGRCRLTSWLVGIARHTIIDEGRRLKHTHYVGGVTENEESRLALSQVVAAPDSTKGGIEQDELVARYRKPLLEAILSIEDSLTPRQKAVFRGRILAGIQANELADCLQLSRPRISQLTAAIQERINEAVLPQAEELAADLAVPTDVILNCLRDLQFFFKSFTSEAGLDETQQTAARGSLDELIENLSTRSQQ